MLRYEKRTKQYATKILSTIKGFTVNEEMINDALAVVNLLRETEGIDPNKVSILGHSLGAMLAPRIATQGKGLPG